MAASANESFKVYFYAGGSIVLHDLNDLVRANSDGGTYIFPAAGSPERAELLKFPRVFRIGSFIARDHDQLITRVTTELGNLREDIKRVLHGDDPNRFHSETINTSPPNIIPMTLIAHQAKTKFVLDESTVICPDHTGMITESPHRNWSVTKCEDELHVLYTA